MTDWKDGFHKAVKEYFDIPQEATIHIGEDCTYWEGCPTCGGTYEWEVTAWYREKGKFISHTYKASLADFIAQL